MSAFKWGCSTLPRYGTRARLTLEPHPHPVLRCAVVGRCLAVSKLFTALPA